MRLPLLAFVFASVLSACDIATTPETVAPASATQSRRPGSSLEPYRSQWVATGLDTSRFHMRYDQRDYHGMYALTDDRLRATVSEDQFTTYIAGLRDRLGDSGRTREIQHRASPIVGSDDVEITIVLDSQFEKGLAVETFVWRVTASNVTYLLSYDVAIRLARSPEQHG